MNMAAMTPLSQVQYVSQTPKTIPPSLDVDPELDLYENLDSDTDSPRKLKRKLELASQSRFVIDWTFFLGIAVFGVGILLSHWYFLTKDILSYHGESTSQTILESWKPLVNLLPTRFPCHKMQYVLEKPSYLVKMT